MSVPLPRPAFPQPRAHVAASVGALPRPLLGLTDAVAIIVGTVIGAGIFRTPPLVAAHAGSEAVTLLAWVVGGAVSLVGALCYAELASAYPNAGGEYHYLSRAFGRRVGFLFAWARISVVQTGSIALLAFVLGDYASQLYRLGPHSAALYALIAIAGLTTVNVLGVRHGTRAQTLLTSLEVAGVLVVIASGVILASAPAAAAAAPPATTPAFGLVMVFVLLTYGGWNEAAYLSAEIRDPRRNIARAFIVSLVLVTLLYILVNVAMLAALGHGGVARSEAVAADIMARAFGAPGAVLVSVLIVVCAATSANARHHDRSADAVRARTRRSTSVTPRALERRGQHARERAGFPGRFRHGARCPGCDDAQRLRDDGRIHRAGLLDVLSAERRLTARLAPP